MWEAWKEPSALHTRPCHPSANNPLLNCTPTDQSLSPLPKGGTSITKENRQKCVDKIQLWSVAMGNVICIFMCRSDSTFSYYWCIRHVLSETTLFLYKFTIHVSFLHSIFTPVGLAAFLELVLKIHENFCQDFTCQIFFCPLWIAVTEILFQRLIWTLSGSFLIPAQMFVMS